MWNAKKTAMPDTYWILDEKGGMVAKTEFGKEKASLIAAAPELLDIAKAYRNLLKTMAHTDGEVATFQHIESVLARATGEQE